MLLAGDSRISYAIISFVNETISHSDLTLAVCDLFNDGKAYPSLNYDLLSTPSIPSKDFSYKTWTETDEAQTMPVIHGMEETQCATKRIATTTCGAAPCYRNGAAAENGQDALPLTCLCPMQGHGFYATGEDFGLIAPDLGHMSCDDYELNGGDCAINGDTTVSAVGDFDDMCGTGGQDEEGCYIWARERVDAMATASRIEDMGTCRSQVDQLYHEGA